MCDNKGFCDSILYFSRVGLVIGMTTVQKDVYQVIHGMSMCVIGSVTHFSKRPNHKCAFHCALCIYSVFRRNLVNSRKQKYRSWKADCSMPRIIYVCTYLIGGSNRPLAFESI